MKIDSDVKMKAERLHHITTVSKRGAFCVDITVCRIMFLSLQLFPIWSFFLIPPDLKGQSSVKIEESCR